MVGGVYKLSPPIPRQELYLHWSLVHHGHLQLRVSLMVKRMLIVSMITLKMMMAKVTGKIERKRSVLAIWSLPYAWGNYWV